MFKLIGVLIALAGVGLYQYKDDPQLKKILHSESMETVKSEVSKVAQKLGVEDAKPDPKPKDGLSALHKCIGGEKPLYTDQPCPKGQKTAAVNGNVTVLSSSTTPAPAKEAESKPKDLAAILGVSGDQIKDKMIDKVVNK